MEGRVESIRTCTVQVQQVERSGNIRGEKVHEHPAKPHGKAWLIVTNYIIDQHRGERPGHKEQVALEHLVVQLRETFRILLANSSTNLQYLQVIVNMCDAKKLLVAALVVDFVVWEVVELQIFLCII